MQSLEVRTLLTANISVSVSDATAVEGTPPNTGEFLITRSGDTSSMTMVNFSFSGTASSGSDYSASESGMIMFNPGETEKRVLITPMDDFLSESPETVQLNLMPGMPGMDYVLGTSSATLTITDPPPPSVSITALTPTTSEPTTMAGVPTPGTFRISRPANAMGSLVVKFTLSGTATVSTDYTMSTDSAANFQMPSGGNPGQVTIGAGASYVDVHVAPAFGLETEGDETVVLTLVDDNNPDYDIATGSATVTIVDAPPPEFSFPIAPPTAVNEGSVVSFSISATTQIDYYEVLWGDEPGTQSPPQQISANGSGPTNLSHPYLDDNPTATPSDNVQIRIKAWQGSNSWTVDPIPLTVNNVSPTQSPLMFTSFSVEELENVTANFTLADGITSTFDTFSWKIAWGDGQFSSGSGAMAGSNSASHMYDTHGVYNVTLSVWDDDMSEGNATTSSASLTVRPPKVTVWASDPTASEWNSGMGSVESGRFTFTRTGNIAHALTISYTLDGVAENDVDYTGVTGSLSGSLTFASGQSTIDLEIVPLADDRIEGSETVQIILEDGSSGGAGATYLIDEDTCDAEGTIADNTARSIVGLMADTHAVERTSAVLGFGTTFKLTFVRFLTADTPRTALDVKYKYDWGNGAGFADSADVSSITNPNAVQTVAFGVPTVADIARGNQRVTVTLTAVSDNVVEMRETFKVLVDESDFYTIVLPDGKIVEGTNRRWAEQKATFTIYEGVVFACLPGGQPVGQETTELYYNDLMQATSDCYLIAAMIAAVRRDSAQISQIIAPTNGGYTVTFRGGASVFVSASDLDRGPDMINLQNADIDASGNVEIWPAILEQAYALLRAQQQSRPPGESYYALMGGDSSDAYENLTDRSTTFLYPNGTNRAEIIQQIKDAIQNGKQVMMATKDVTPKPTSWWYGDHVYVVTAITDTTISLINPHDPFDPDNDMIGNWFDTDLKRFIICN